MIRKITYRIFGIALMMMVLLGQNAFSRSTFSGERLKKACMDYLENTIHQDFEADIRDIESQSFEEAGVIARCIADETSLKGRTNILLEFVYNNTVLSRIQVPVRIRLFAEVPVAEASIRKGAIIRASDIRIERKDISAYSAGDFLSQDEIIGQKSDAVISQGTIISRALLAKQKIIRRGERVSVIAQSGCVRIRTSGESLQDGAAGEKIRVKRDGSQAIFTGKVVDDGSVLIENE